jgi:hypothetical protein
MDATARFIFESAIDDQRTSVVTLCVGEKTESILGKFCDRDLHSFCFETSLWPDFASQNGGQTATFQFGTRDSAVQFEAEIKAVQKKGQAVLVRCANPEEIEVIQRRAHFRVPVPANGPLALTAWKIPSHWVLRDRPKPSAQLKSEMIDLSLGGVSLKAFPSKVNPDLVTYGDRLRLEMRFENSEAIIDALVAYRSDPFPDGSIQVGIAFQKMENSIEGRRAGFLLDRAIATLQRNALKETVVA